MAEEQTRDTPESLEKMVREGLADVKHVEIIDLSDGCGDKFHLTVVSDAFEGVKLLERHRMLQEAIDEAMKRIHAVELKTYTPAQWEKRSGASS
ncbi:Protein BOLA2 [Hondaea fermentalgiana]|uniref:Protein BOLA2 n=1 Tax=Hondaea fermentalgiana TaxID=2315210 RepID=A0A2R5G7V9_9STRA|nr:Protein BOLA2 [Hondaea fermentalgiana]|eukprot:GBG27146.1 Protein BOLA2 [Hondaea fermentalgiana]